ncbi:hypothetical protein DPMN_100863 [Dreissena polymorpha]|uniref:Uncharacterized protein n=1 Tax=Dreissena polymorpha TaxID=45954 RepID=A0A9D4LIC1_DREPO|nr:hypothetical protein DPMN_100863 [Dreissena polymorpha]
MSTIVKDTKADIIIVNGDWNSKVGPDTHSKTRTSLFAICSECRLLLLFKRFGIIRRMTLLE